MKLREVKQFIEFMQKQLDEIARIEARLAEITSKP